MIRNLSRLAISFWLLALTACGFHPLYATSGLGGKNVDAALGQVQIASIPNREGQELRNLLIDRLQHRGRPVEPQYDLTITLQESQSDLGIRTDATSARSQLAMTARYSLTARATAQPVLSAIATSTVGYNKLDAQYSNLAAQEDARRRALSEVSDQITSRLSLYFGTLEQRP
ncbi:MAG: LPS assembly lipoprotein LptE [Alphaproteobacteria bacterium]